MKSTSTLGWYHFQKKTFNTNTYKYHTVPYSYINHTTTIKFKNHTILHWNLSILLIRLTLIWGGGYKTLQPANIKANIT